MLHFHGFHDQQIAALRNSISFGHQEFDHGSLDRSSYGAGLERRRDVRQGHRLRRILPMIQDRERVSWIDLGADDNGAASGFLLRTVRRQRQLV